MPIVENFFPLPLEGPLGVHAVPGSFATMFRTTTLFIALAVGSSLPSLVASAQEPVPVPAATMDSTFHWEQALAEADSAGDRPAAVRARLALAARGSQGKALRLVREALALVDSAGLDPALGLAAAQRQVELLTAMGMVAAAADAWPELLLYKDAAMRQDAQRSLDAERALMVARITHVNDSLASVMARTRKEAASAAQVLRAGRDRWFYISIAAGALALVALGLLMVLRFGTFRRMRRELAELRQEVTWLRVVHRKHLEAKVAAAPAPVVPAMPVSPTATPAAEAATPAPAPLPSAAENEDAVLLELVKRRGVERLYTLREARLRGDREKVLRVVRSLKPQLVSLDAAHFTELCDRLVSGDVASATWSQDLDRFEQGLERLIAGRG